MYGRVLCIFSGSGAVQLAALPRSWWVTFPLSPPALVHLRHTMHAPPVVPLCGPSDKGLRADGVCGVLAPLHACHARCYVSCGINMCSYYACVVHVMWDCNYSAAVHCMLLRPRGPFISFSVPFHCAVLGLAELQVLLDCCRFGLHLCALCVHCNARFL